MARILPIALLCTVLGLAASAARAGDLEIQISGLNLVYDGTDIYDAGGKNGRTGDPANADPLQTMTFLLDDELIGTLNSSIYIDVLIQDALNLPLAGGLVTTGGNPDGFGIDLFTDSTAPAWGLGLNIDTLDLFHFGAGIAIAISGNATGAFAQNLPFGAVFDEPIETVSLALFSANLSNVTTDGMYLTGFEASGTGAIAGVGTAGIGVPEPAAMVLLGGGGLLLLVRRKRC